MKLKYYLRGLGIGIIVTTLVLMVSLSGSKEKLSDEEIIERAEALGMVMADTEETKEEGETESSETKSTETDTKIENTTENAQVSAEQNSEPEQSTEGMGAVPPETEPVSQEVAEQPTAVSEISFTVSAGESSDTVAFNLYKAGLVDDATAFNRYMVKNGYDSRLRTGTFQIKTGSSYDDVLKILAP